MKQFGRTVQQSLDAIRLYHRAAAATVDALHERVECRVGTCQGL
jgi:hypothetical protein